MKVTIPADLSYQLQREAARYSETIDHTVSRLLAGALAQPAAHVDWFGEPPSEQPASSEANRAALAKVRALLGG